jgi:hypothetical protein
LEYYTNLKFFIGTQFLKLKPISLKDLQKIKAKAAENNLPYQTLIASLIRQYIQGKIQIVL